MKKIIIFVLNFLAIITLTSCADKTISLPDIKGMTFEEAQVLCKDINLNPVEEATIYATPGTILGYVEEAIEVEKGSVVDVRVAKELSFDERVKSVTYIDHLTGPDSKNNGELLLDSGAHGTDLGISFAFKGKTVFLFGDTFSGPDREGFWNSNFITVSEDNNLKDGIEFTDIIRRPNGMIKPFAQGNHDEDNASDKSKEVTKIPTGAITIGDTVYLFYMSVRYWGANAGWLVTFNQCLKSQDLETWEEVEGLRWNDEEAYNFGQIYPFDDPNSDYIYFYAIPGGRSGGLVCARVLENEFENKDAYEYEVGPNEWIKGALGLETLKENPYYLVNPRVAEPCVTYNPYLGKYVFTHSMGGSCMFTADNPYEPFIDKVVLVDSQYLGTYGVFTSSNLFEENGKVFYIACSRWAEYNVYLLRIELK